MTPRETAPAYVSAPCTIGPHDACTEAEPPKEDPVPGLIYLVCTCFCHTRTAQPAEPPPKRA